ncbi:MAG: hypothetical protein JWO81_1397 [Alphaproteobacteria bacterium]|nr:hypothetical protein [Alphaproteobacteria bacterium]
MEFESATNPVEGADTSLDIGSPAQEVSQELDPSTGSGQDSSTSSGQAPEEEEPGDADPASEIEEVEHDGKKYQVPKALKDAFLRQADYTRKTQEVADLRRAVEAERQAIRGTGEAEVAARAQLVTIDQQLAHYQRIDWDTWEDQDPFEAQKGWRQFQQLQNARSQAAGQFAQVAQQRHLVQQQETARQIEEGRAVLARDIKDWSPRLAEALLDHGVSQYGFQRGEIEEFTDPRMVKVLHDAWQYRSIAKKQQQAQRHAAAQTAEPAARVGTSASPPKGLDDRLSVDEWARRRNEQVRKRVR